MIEVKNVTKVFDSRKKGKVTAVKDISFEVKKGEIFGLLGPNGAGKTTSLRMISTLMKPTKGTIRVNGFDVVKEPKKVRKGLGFLTSDMKLYDTLTPRELLEFFGRLNHLSEDTIEKRTEEISEYLDMKGFLDKKVGKLSTGMKQKAAISISLIHDPNVIVFDEPTNGLDVITAHTVMELLKDFRKRGKTILISTHVMSVAEKLCDKIGILLKGELKAIGALDDLRKRFGMMELEDIFFALVGKMGEVHV
ncbi:MAG: ABC transporter ATP-binding protein [Thermotogae bacterium]|nr:ABC transporter ATP-binding protein [Thermotogota bacterium]